MFLQTRQHNPLEIDRLERASGRLDRVCPLNGARRLGDWCGERVLITDGCGDQRGGDGDQWLIRAQAERRIRQGFAGDHLEVQTAAGWREPDVIHDECGSRVAIELLAEERERSAAWPEHVHPDIDSRQRRLVGGLDSLPTGFIGRIRLIEIGGQSGFRGRHQPILAREIQLADFGDVGLGNGLSIFQRDGSRWRDALRFFRSRGCGGSGTGHKEGDAGDQDDRA